MCISWDRSAGTFLRHILVGLHSCIKNALSLMETSTPSIIIPHLPMVDLWTINYHHHWPFSSPSSLSYKTITIFIIHSTSWHYYYHLILPLYPDIGLQNDGRDTISSSSWSPCHTSWNNMLRLSDAAHFPYTDTYVTHYMLSWNRHERRCESLILESDKPFSTSAKITSM